MSFDETSETRGHLLGISTGWGQAADSLLDMATKAFSAGNDDTANLLRDCSRRCREMKSLRRTEYDEYKSEHPAHE